MIEAIELQVITRLLTSQNDDEINCLLSYDPDKYFSAFNSEIKFIHVHKDRYGIIPTIFEFQTEFPDCSSLPQVNQPIDYFIKRLKEYRRYQLLLSTFNGIKDLGEGDVDAAWKYLEMQVNEASSYDDCQPIDIIKQSDVRTQQIRDYANQKRIPTGFKEIDQVMYGGLNPSEELLVLVARTNAGKSWVCIKMMESAQKNGFAVAYYSPEMRAAYVGIRFDTWRNNFENSELYKANFSDEYLAYIENLKQSETPAYVLEDKDLPDGASVSSFTSFVQKHHIKLLIVDGISYMKDDRNATRDQEKYKNIALGLFQLSKKEGCAVVLVMQANREVKSKDNKGESIPDLFNTEGSDQPGRIATQAVGIRQVFDQHVLDIKLLKSRAGINQSNVFSYSWSINDGKLMYIESSSTDGDNSSNSSPNATGSFRPISFGTNGPDDSDLSMLDDANSLSSYDSEYEGIEF